MSEMIQFVANYNDLSTDRGYQFKFFCDQCGNGHLSRYEPSTLGAATGLLRAAGDLFGGIFHSAGNSAYEIQRAIGGKQHDEALKRAVDAGRQHFKQCTRCGHWVCPEVCWNGRAGLCESCAPDEHEELAAQKARATAEQIYDKARTMDYTADLNFDKHAAALNKCGGCGASLSPQARFCGDCGTPATPAQAKPRFCSGCGGKLESGAKFCPGCGAKGP